MDSVYVVDAVGSGRVKIGFSSSLMEREYELRTACPYPIRISASVLCDDLEGSKRLEAEAHKYFSSARIVGEWFTLSPEHVIYDLIHKIGVDYGGFGAAITPYMQLLPREQLPEHVVIHHYMYRTVAVCPLCGKEFSADDLTRSESLFKRHMRTEMKAIFNLYQYWTSREEELPDKVKMGSKLIPKWLWDELWYAKEFHRLMIVAGVAEYGRALKPWLSRRDRRFGGG